MRARLIDLDQHRLHFSAWLCALACLGLLPAAANAEVRTATISTSTGQSCTLSATTAVAYALIGARFTYSDSISCGAYAADEHAEAHLQITGPNGAPLTWTDPGYYCDSTGGTCYAGGTYSAPWEPLSTYRYVASNYVNVWSPGGDAWTAYPTGSSATGWHCSHELSGQPSELTCFAYLSGTY